MTLLGYEQRLSRFGNQITATLAGLNQEAIRQCEELQADIAAHRRAKIGQRTEQLSRTEMALRLLRWLAAPVPAATSFSELANVYRKMGRSQQAAALSLKVRKLLNQEREEENAASRFQVVRENP